MNKKILLDENLIQEIKEVGVIAFQSWLSENNISISSTNNFFENIETGLQAGSFDLNTIYKALNELEENSDKKIRLYQVKNYVDLSINKKSILKHLKVKFGMDISVINWVRVIPKAKPTFNYLFVDENQIKIKYSELQFDFEIDIENDKIKRIPKKVCVIFILDINDGFVQIRFDNAAQNHTHKNDTSKPTEAAYENYYKDLLFKLFPDISFLDLNLKTVANHIATKEKIKFRMNREVTTITGNAKQIFSSSSIKKDIRDLPEHKAAAASDLMNSWLTEDLSGYWLAEHSENELKKDLFMRISRKISEIRVQRGCLEKELNYGIKQIREIQKGI